MTALFERRIRVGGDPRGFSEFAALREELAKLNHGACPDVDWAWVEQLCLALFELNGAEMHGACFYTLARGQRHGVQGITQGVTLLEALSCEWARLWPPMASARLELLEWLFDQLQLLLRSMAMHAGSAPALVQLDAELARLQARLRMHSPSPQLTLQALQAQIDSLIQRLDHSSLPGETGLAPTRAMAAALMTSVVIVPPAGIKPRVPRLAPWWFVGALSGILAAGFGGYAWQPGANNESLMPEPIRVASMSLFDAGSATLKPGSTKVLINALVGIQAQPGWLIVIAGHTDASGNIEQNLVLSHTRAAAVRDWMRWMSDIADSCFAVQGFAADRPIASNETEAGRAANRRVDIQLVPQAGACGQAVAAVE